MAKENNNTGLSESSGKIETPKDRSEMKEKATNIIMSRDIQQQEGSNVSDQERADLFKAANDMPGDDENLRNAALDSTDADGTPLNEDSFGDNVSPDDLDVPGASLDDDEERIGEEDEENNEYSIGGAGSNDQDGSPSDEF